MRPAHAPLIFSVLLAAGTPAAAQRFHDHDGACHAVHPTLPGVELAHACWPGEDGQLTGRRIPVETLDPETVALREHLANRDLLRGSVPDRIDIVFVGDGYTASQQALFQSDVDNIVADLFQYEPFITYEPFFRIHRVEVISNESGVDNDPTQGIFRDTALDMAFWCGGTERALCVSVNKALSRAGAGVATDVDQVVAIANTTKYGGVGYPSSNACTSSGRNSAATQIVIHELGHSLGNLADEYTYGGPTTYTGGELGPADVSIYNQAQQVAQQRKWWRWMGEVNPLFDGPVGTYEGGNYSEFGVYRPSNNSMMRSLGRRFNLPSAEELIKEFYREVNPIDDATPTDADLAYDDTLFCAPVQPNGHDLNIQWEVNGQVVFAALDQTSLDLSTLGLDPNIEHTVRVTVVDNTPWVRNPVIRDLFLTETREWTVNACTHPGDFDGNEELNIFDILVFIEAYNQQDPAADFDANGLFNFFDVASFIAAFNGPCVR